MYWNVATFGYLLNVWRKKEKKKSQKRNWKNEEREKIPSICKKSKKLATKEAKEKNYDAWERILHSIN